MKIHLFCVRSMTVGHIRMGHHLARSFNNRMFSNVAKCFEKIDCMTVPEAFLSRLGTYMMLLYAFFCFDGETAQAQETTHPCMRQCHKGPCKDCAAFQVRSSATRRCGGRQICRKRIEKAQCEGTKVVWLRWICSMTTTACTSRSFACGGTPPVSAAASTAPSSASSTTSLDPVKETRLERNESESPRARPPVRTGKPPHTLEDSMAPHPGRSILKHPSPSTGKFLNR